MSPVSTLLPTRHRVVGREGAPLQPRKQNLLEVTVQHCISSRPVRRACISSSSARRARAARRAEECMQIEREEGESASSSCESVGLKGRGALLAVPLQSGGGLSPADDGRVAQPSSDWCLQQQIEARRCPGSLHPLPPSSVQLLRSIHIRNHGAGTGHSHEE
jgi:hypothetical protein